MKKVLTILKSELFKRGGAEKYARALAHAFHEKGCQVKVITSGPVQDVPFEVETYRPKFKASAAKLWEFVRYAHMRIKEGQPGIVFGMDRTPLQTHLRAGSGVHRIYLEQRKKTEDAHLAFRHKFNPLHLSLLGLEKIAFEHPDLQKLYTNSHMVKKEVTENFIIDPCKIEVIHNGVEWNAFEIPFFSWEKLHNPDRYSFLFIGSGYERKGLRRLLQSLSALKEKEWTLTVIGKDKKPKYFIDLAHHLGIGDKVEFLGFQKETTSHLQKADCLVIPSYYDPFANVTVEALAMGLFVVSSKTNGGSEILTPKTGALIEDLASDAAVRVALETALATPKTPSSASFIRDSARPFDFSNTLKTYVDSVLC